LFVVCQAAQQPFFSGRGWQTTKNDRLPTSAPRKQRSELLLSPERIRRRTRATASAGRSAVCIAPQCKDLQVKSIGEAAELRT
jgi:hypothetical protein